MMRASVSAPPPGGNGTTMRTGFEGKPCPTAAADAKSRTAAVDLMLPRPEHALILIHDAHALVFELLHPLALLGLRRIQVAPGVDRDAVHAVELAGLAAAVSEIRHLLERVAQHDPHFLVAAVGHEEVFLVPVLRT